MYELDQSFAKPFQAVYQKRDIVSQRNARMVLHSHKINHKCQFHNISQ